VLGMSFFALNVQYVFDKYFPLSVIKFSRVQCNLDNMIVRDCCKLL